MIDPITRENVRLDAMTPYQRHVYNQHLIDAAPVMLVRNGFKYFCEARKEYADVGGKRQLTLRFFDVLSRRYIGNFLTLKRSGEWQIVWKNNDSHGFRDEFGDV